MRVKNSYLKKVGLFLIFIIGFLNSNSQTYIPQKAKNKSDASCVFTYYYVKGVSNRPSASIVFKHGFEFYLNAVCGEKGSDGISYDWCVRNNDIVDIAYMNVRFNSKSNAAEIKILKNEYSNKYIKYLNLFKGTFVRVSK